MLCAPDLVPCALGRLGRLVPAAAAQGIASFALGLPTGVSAHILECLVSDGPAACDHAIALTRGDGGFTRFSPPAGPFWTEAARVIDATGGALAEAGILWFEFDVDDGGRPAPPSVFVAPGAAGTGGPQALGLAQSLFTLLVGGPPPDIRGLSARLPRGAHLKQAGVMTGRGVRAARLVIDGLRAGAIPDCLAALGWPGDMARARRLAGVAGQLAGDGHCRVDLDLGQSLAPTLGIEIAVSALDDPAAAAGLLVAHALCTGERRADLAAAAPRRTLTRPGPGLQTEFGLNHLKLSAPPDAADTAKAYFSLLTLPDFRHR